MLLYLTLALFILWFIDIFLVACMDMYLREALQEPEMNAKYNPEGKSMYSLLYSPLIAADIYKEYTTVEEGKVGIFHRIAKITVKATLAVMIAVIVLFILLKAGYIQKNSWLYGGIECSRALKDTQ